MQNIKQDLKDFYDKEADKFHNTRKKHWPEFDHILKIIKKSKKRNISILELGCGGGRLLGFLKENTKKNISYTGVDISSGLIEIAQMENPEATFMVGDMLGVVQDLPQNSYDFVVAVASFQHLPNYKERLLTLKSIYRLLNYGGEIVMTNWSFSQRFLEKYKKDIFKSFFRQFLGKYKYNDIFVPWKQDSTGVVFHRYYHIFSLGELKKLIKYSGFILEKLTYINKEGEMSDQRKNSRNTFLVARKDVI